MVSVIQGGTTASSHETHGANHGLSTRDACSETGRKTRLGKPQFYPPMQTRKQIHSLANPCNATGCHFRNSVLCKNFGITRNNIFCKENISPPDHLLPHSSTELLTTCSHTLLRKETLEHLIQTFHPNR